jgi:4-amino-4-deoxy-L-arabinose transferase-like glycosyltransferase
VLAGLYSLLGDCAIASYSLFCVLGALACVLTYALARAITTEIVARVAGILAAVYLPHAYMASQYISENLYVPALALGLWLFVLALKRDSLVSVALAGLTLGWATLTRPGALLLLPLLVGVLLWNTWRAPAPRRRFWTASPLFAVAFLGVILPWTIRNHQVHGKWILIATNGGTTFWGGNNDRVLNETRHLGYWVPSTELPHRDKIDSALNEAHRDDIEWQLGKDWVSEHRASLPLLALYKLARLWWLPDFGGGPRWVRVVSYAPFFLLYASFLVRFAWRRDCWTVSWQVVHASTLVVIVTALIFCGEPRYRDANLPVLMMYASLGLLPRAWLASAMQPSDGVCTAGANTVR